MRLSKQQKQALLYALNDGELSVTGMDARPVNMRTVESLERLGLLKVSDKYQQFTSVYNQCLSYALTDQGRKFCLDNLATQGR